LSIHDFRHHCGGHASVASLHERQIYLGEPGQPASAFGLLASNGGDRGLTDKLRGLGSTASTARSVSHDYEQPLCCGFNCEPIFAPLGPFKFARHKNHGQIRLTPCRSAAAVPPRWRFDSTRFSCGTAVRCNGLFDRVRTEAWT
jgi:hypothetical protein